MPKCHWHDIWTLLFAFRGLGVVVIHRLGRWVGRQFGRGCWLLLHGLSLLISSVQFGSVSQEVVWSKWACIVELKETMSDRSNRAELIQEWMSDRWCRFFCFCKEIITAASESLFLLFSIPMDSLRFSPSFVFSMRTYLRLCLMNDWIGHVMHVWGKLMWCSDDDSVSQECFSQLNIHAEGSLQTRLVEKSQQFCLYTPDSTQQTPFILPTTSSCLYYLT